MISKRNLRSQGAIFRFHVKLWNIVLKNKKTSRTSQKMLQEHHFYQQSSLEGNHQYWHTALKLTWNLKIIQLKRKLIFHPPPFCWVPLILLPRNLTYWKMMLGRWFICFWGNFGRGKLAIKLQESFVFQGGRFWYCWWFRNPAFTTWDVFLTLSIL